MKRPITITVLAAAIAGLLGGCTEHRVYATDQTSVGQRGLVIDSTQFTERTWDPVIGPSVEGNLIVHNDDSEKHDQVVRCEGRPHQKQLLVWSEDRYADLNPGQSMELWFYGHPTRGGLLDITCQVVPEHVPTTVG